MDLLQPVELESAETVVRRARLAHPKCKSDVGALLEEICTGIDPRQQEQAAWAYGMRGYSRGFKRIQNFVLASQERWEGRRGLGYDGFLTYFALGKMDIPASHQFLIEQSKSPLLCTREAARHGMAWEKDQFDVDLILAMLEDDQDESAIYDA